MNILKISVCLSLIIFLLVSSVFVLFEPSVTIALDDSATVSATVTSEVTISSPSDVSFSSSIPGVSGNPGSPATASLAWTVTTNNSSGFDLALKASQTNALYKDGTYYFTDYGSSPTLGWSAAGSGVANFGFSISTGTPADTATAFKDNGSSCGSGDNTGGCWRGFDSTNSITVVHRTSLTSSSGETETVNFKAESNGKYLASGNYTATITATASLN